ncbi:MAG: hypothetical protein H0T46_23260 [Deltaproteobacteria bacterium]|nr:hypothetical protein [Deltaproteobacteria bacterium]
MSYRDDRDADRARIEALEAELAVARKKIDELENRRSQALAIAHGQSMVATTGSRKRKAPWYGAPLRLELAHMFEGEYPKDELETLIDLIRGVTRESGRAELLKSSMTWSAGTNPRATGPFTVVTVSVRDGKTSLLVTDSLGQLAGGLYGGLGGGLGGGAIMVPIIAFLSMPPLIPAAVATWLGGVFLGTRAIFKRAARRRAEALETLFSALVVEISQRISKL